MFRFTRAHYVCRSLEKTFCNPVTYLGAILVGGMSYLASGYAWGAAVPFLMPLLVQSMTRVAAAREQVQQQASLSQHLQRDDSEMDSLSIVSIRPLHRLLRQRQQQGPVSLLILKINHATEVVRLSEPDDGDAEEQLIQTLAFCIQQEFEDGEVFRLASDRFLVLLPGRYERCAQRVCEFVEQHTPYTITINNTEYYPKLFAGVTELDSDIGTTLSRLQFACDKALEKCRGAFVFSPDRRPRGVGASA
ncbi:MAG: GGDEF domain-containing protein [Motiliproteus sp.]